MREAFRKDRDEQGPCLRLSTLHRCVGSLRLAYVLLPCLLRLYLLPSIARCLGPSTTMLRGIRLPTYNYYGYTYHSTVQARELMRGAAEAHRSERAALRRQLEEQARTKK